MKASTTDETVPEPASQAEAEAQAQSAIQCAEDPTSPLASEAAEAESALDEADPPAVEPAVEDVAEEQGAAVNTPTMGDALNGAVAGASGVQQTQRATTPWQNRPRFAREPPPPGKRLFVGNLRYETTEEKLQELFGYYGQLSSVRIVLDSSGSSRGFGYVEYTDLDSAARAIRGLHSQIIDGRSVIVNYHMPKPRVGGGPAVVSSEPNKTLFIGNLSFQMTDKDLNDLFRPLRNVMDVRVAIDRRTGQPRGFAHADFVDIASAERAKEQLEGRDVFGRILRIDYSNHRERTGELPFDQPPEEGQ